MAKLDESGCVEHLAVGAVILAAGASSRMGQPKMLLPWGSGTVLSHAVALWRQVGATQIAVVCAADGADVGAELDRIDLPLSDRILNPDSARGMFSSIQCAARWEGWKSDLTHWAIALGDQPHLRPASVRALIDRAAQRPETICQPSHHGRPRHPVLLPRSAFAMLTHTEVETLREFLKTTSTEIALLEINDPGLDLDIDDPEDYERALRLFQETQAVEWHEG